MEIEKKIYESPKGRKRKWIRCRISTLDLNTFSLTSKIAKPEGVSRSVLLNVIVSGSLQTQIDAKEKVIL